MYYLSPTARACINRWELALFAAQAGAVAKNTHRKRDGHWRKWQSFLTTIELSDDPFLQRFDPHYQTRLLCCFASAIQENGPELQSIPGSARAAVQERSVRAVLHALASTYRANKLPSPIHDNAGRLNHLLGCQLKGFKNSDPSPTPQKAVSPSVIRAIASATDTSLDWAIGQLVIGTFFFAICSCEYSSVPGERHSKKLLKLRNIRFYKNIKTIVNYPLLRFFSPGELCLHYFLLPEE